ncbi:MAG: hypothetical protein ACRD5R_10370 [Candidatus Acidiferrales bacterium]
MLSAVTGSGSGSYVYDADGQRVAKSVGSAVTYYLYDLAGRVVSEWIGAGGPVNSPNPQGGIIIKK